jgi:hypothetical protein
MGHVARRPGDQQVLRHQARHRLARIAALGEQALGGEAVIPNHFDS